ncbi:hypothetical protein ABZ819_09820 [Streptomyces venezuelae]|uniref:hypothetical protein n=1 Tax=Streptomyces venezuelae TaxID=54571 RepID=UPI003417212B
MGIFNRQNTGQKSTPANPEMTELGRDYAIARRHGDRRAMSRIARELGSRETTDADREAYRQGRDEYDSIPPAYSKPRRRTPRR